MKSVLLSFVVLISSPILAATETSPSGSANPESAVDCSALAFDLQGLRSAQRSLLKNLTGKNEILAETLEILAAQENKTSLTLRKDLKRSAGSLRANGHRESQLAERLAKATEQVLTKVEECLGRSARTD